ncbi:MAG TPA: hypothetical protein VJU61_23120, partial [Polyangiaceae bacterium]|nr:hypothetical protein [Polyangiaceae bacterium]
MLAGRSRTSRQPGTSFASRSSCLAPLLLALGASACGDQDRQPWRSTSPIVIDAENGTLGANVTSVTDATDSSISYVTAAMNGTDPVADSSDARVVSQEIRFPRAGSYQIYARLRIGPGAGADDSFFLEQPGSDPAWPVVNSITGYDVAGSPAYRPGATVGIYGGSAGG